jgi:hypothetical protein
MLVTHVAAGEAEVARPQLGQRLAALGDLHPVAEAEAAQHIGVHQRQDLVGADLQADGGGLPAVADGRKVSRRHSRSAGR